jgi:16S rRNA (cytidine1402-2'-O)-methyltransferase
MNEIIEENKMDEKIKKPGMLYLSATPIGNLEDMTYRSVRILAEVELIAAEDTRHTRHLLTHFDIHTRLTSYHEHNKFTKGPELIAYLLSGKDLVCVSDAGLPGIADPGSHLAQLAIEAGIRVSPLPGANAALSALICSGLDTTIFTFVGFLPKTGKKRKEVLEHLSNREETLIFYESPHHLKVTLKELCDAFGSERRVVIARELTKKFEEFLRGTLVEISSYFADNLPRGEFVIILEGGSEDMQEAVAESLATDSPTKLVARLIAEGMDKKAAMRQVAQTLSISRRDVYQAVLAEKEL